MWEMAHEKEGDEGIRQDPKLNYFWGLNFLPVLLRSVEVAGEV